MAPGQAARQPAQPQRQQAGRPFFGRHRSAFQRRAHAQRVILAAGVARFRCRYADLSISKSDGTAVATPGLNLDYSIVVTNHGSEAVTGALVEDDLPAGLVAKLKSFGQEIDEVSSSSFGVTQAIEVDEQRQFIGVHDPRVPGKAASGARPAVVAAAP